VELYINAFFTFLLILGLVVIYRKRDTSEDLLFIKLVGYYLLGSFRFNLNRLAIPLGFIIYLVFSRPSLNARIKRYAALLGITFFIIGFSKPLISEYLYKRPKQIPVNTVSINTIGFQKDWQLIKEKLEINDDTKIEGFSIHYESDGTIREMRYQLISRKEEGLIHYFVDFFPNKGKYTIRPSKIEQWAQYNRLASAKRFFEVISILDLEAIKPSGTYEWYVVASEGELINYGISERDKFIVISRDNIRKITNDELPIKGFYISSYGMKLESKTAYSISYTSEGITDYFFDVVKK
jgi:hypothetical protein